MVAVDPQQHFNRGKLMPGSGLDGAYTPSLRLVQQEAIILEESELGALNDDVKHCLRCGKCKPVCQTHIPRANLLYSPRNKILASGLILRTVRLRRGRWRRLGRCRAQCRLADRRIERLQCGKDIGPEARHVVIAFIQ